MADTAESMSACLRAMRTVYTIRSVREEVRRSKKGRMADALAHGGDEGRDKLR